MLKSQVLCHHSFALSILSAYIRKVCIKARRGGTGSWCEERRWIGQTGGRQRGEDRQRGQAERGEKAEKERQR